jgi:hypothetical protein
MEEDTWQRGPYFLLFALQVFEKLKNLVPGARWL